MSTSTTTTYTVTVTADPLDAGLIGSAIRHAVRSVGAVEDVTVVEAGCAAMSTDNPSTEALDFDMIGRAVTDAMVMTSFEDRGHRLVALLAAVGYRVAPEGDVLWSGSTQGTEPDISDIYAVVLPVPPGTEVVVTRKEGS